MNTMRFSKFLAFGFLAVMSLAAIILPTIILSTLVFSMIVFSDSSAFAAPAQVIIIRHGEKPASGNDLSPRGVQRAEALVGYFENNPEVNQFGKPVAIYAARPGTSDPSLRMIETVTPLAQALGMQLDTQYEKDDLTPMVREIMLNPNYDGKMVLICWEHKVINTLAATFGVSPQPSPWPDTVFDGVWVINFNGNQVSRFYGLWEHLLPGDH